MNKNLILATLCLASATAMAQETYENAQIATQDLNGTARYIGMGGAMEALGADISTMGTNPAGIGLFRKSWVGASAGVTIQSGSANNSSLSPINRFDKKDGVTNVDFNQLGFVYSTQCGGESWFNLGVNYHKSRNFNMISNAINTLDKASSLNKMTFMRLASLQPDKKLWQQGEDSRWYDMSLMDAVNDDVINYDFMDSGDDGMGGSWIADGYSASDAYHGTYENSGYISEFDFNLSGNFNNRVFLGVSFGLKDVHYDNNTYYTERLIDLDNNPRGTHNVADTRKITGTGFDIKFGIIFRPIEESPFRIGAYIHTPTWYDLTCIGDMGADADFTLGGKNFYNASGYHYDYKYKMTTPWKFGVSLGHTINNMVAIGATYEYADYSFIKNKIVYDYDHSIYSSDYAMDQNTKENLRGVSTAKFGVEVKPVPEVALRLGYNYVSPMYKEDACKWFDIYTNPDDGSSGNYYTTYDYVNWKDTHRVTFGVGFVLSKNFNLDLSYQYSTQKGEYHPFQSVYDLETYGIYSNGDTFLIGNAGQTNIGTPTTIKNDRHQINVTLGYRF